MRKATDVSFVAQHDQTEQRYALILPPSFRMEAAHDVLITLHGHGADRWQFVEDDRDECLAARNAAAQYNMILVSPDYRSGTSWMGPRAEADVVQVIQDLKETYRISRIILCGASMGGAASLTFAVLHPDLVDGIASMNGTANLVEFGNFQDAIAESYGGTKEEVPLEYRKRSAEYCPERLTMPLGLAVSGRDRSVPPESILRLVEKLKRLGHRKVKLMYAPDGEHVTTYEDAMTILEFAILSARETCSASGPRQAAPASPSES